MELFPFRRLPLINAGVFLLLLLASAAADIASDKAALLYLKFSVGSPIIHWDQSSTTPCSWSGVVCSLDGSAVVKLRLPAKGLSGRLPPKAFSNMTRLRTLSLRYNSLTGPLPAAIFESLTSLEKLYLQHNSFSGQLPVSLFSLPNLVHLNLGGNKFSGPIASAFNNFYRLQSLLLYDNNFSSTIPDFRLQKLDHFNISNNHLIGRIPAALSNNPASSFAGNSLCGLPLNPCGDDHLNIPPPGKDNNNSDDTSRNRMVEVIIPSVLGGLLIIALIGFFVYIQRRKGSSKAVTSVDNAQISRNGNESSGAFPANLIPSGSFRASSNGGCTLIDVENNRLVFLGKVEYTFGLEELLWAPTEVLGKGSFGMTY